MFEYYFKYSTSNTIDFASNDSIAIPAIDFCFPMPPETARQSKIRNEGENKFFVEVNNNLFDKTEKSTNASIIYYMLHGMLCHSVRVDIQSTTNLYSDHGIYSYNNAMRTNDHMALRSAKYVVGNFTLLGQMHISLHSQKELAHNPVDNFMLAQHSFKVPLTSWVCYKT